MKRDKEYSDIWFDNPSIEKMIQEFQNIVKEPGKTNFLEMSIRIGDEMWQYDTIEEFISNLQRGADRAQLTLTNDELKLSVIMKKPSSYVPSEVYISSNNRNHIIRLANIIDACAKACFIPPPPKPIPPKPKIFIGHGSSLQWRDLKDHLHEQHGYEIIAYETGSRAGHTIRDVISEMLEKSSFAILVMTGEEHMEDGTITARQNVIHEIGLFQGKLGFTKAIVLKEEGTEEFSNIHGVNQIRYSKGNIKETFGDVLAVLNREFGKRH